MSELTAADETRHCEDEVHALELRPYLCDRLQVEPAQHGRACALPVLSCIFDTQSKGMLHDLHKRPLAGRRHVLGHVLNDSILGKHRLTLEVEDPPPTAVGAGAEGDAKKRTHCF